MIDDLKARLSSRKFWVAVAGAVYFGLSGDLESVKMVVLGYLAAEGVADAAGRFNS